MRPLVVLLLPIRGPAETARDTSRAPSSRTGVRPTSDRPWTIGPQPCPEDALDSIAYVHGSVGERVTKEEVAPMGPASVHSEAVDRGATPAFIWEKRSEVRHQSDWSFVRLDTGGGRWTYRGRAGHRARTLLDPLTSAPTDAPPRMADIQSEGASGLTSSSRRARLDGPSGGGLHSSRAGGRDREDGRPDPQHPAYLVVEERTSFELVVGFQAEVQVGLRRDAGGGHTSSLAVILLDHATGAVVLDTSARPVQHSWSLSTDASATTKESGRSSIILGPGEYALSMQLTDETWSWAVSEPRTSVSSAEISSSVRATVDLLPRGRPTRGHPAPAEQDRPPPCRVPSSPTPSTTSSAMSTVPSASSPRTCPTAASSSSSATAAAATTA